MPQRLRGSQTKRGSVRMWHMDMISACQSVASLRWTARTICVQKRCKPSAYLALERELMKRLCWLQAQKFWCTDPPTWWSKPCSARMWAWCPSCLNPNRRTTNRLKTQGRDVSSGKCSPAKFLKAGPACMQEWPGSGSRDVFNSKLV